MSFVLLTSRLTSPGIPSRLSLSKITTIIALNTFEVNPNYKVTIVSDIGSEKRNAVVIDDFYKYPDLVRDLALKMKRSDDPFLIQELPGERCFQEVKGLRDNIRPVFDKYCLDQSLWKREINVETYNQQFNTTEFMVNFMNEDTVVNKPFSNIPHQDVYWGEPDALFQFGVMIYLNLPEECAGGTNVYSYRGKMSYDNFNQIEKPSGFDEKVDSNDSAFDFIRDWIYDETREWKVEHEFEMRYNRVVIIEAGVMHSANVGRSMFNNFDRVNQVFWL
jgi:hypothetical protein